MYLYLYTIIMCCKLTQRAWFLPVNYSQNRFLQTGKFTAMQPEPNPVSTQWESINELLGPDIIFAQGTFCFHLSANQHQLGIDAVKLRLSDTCCNLI
jgi:hypothetical protein